MNNSKQNSTLIKPSSKLKTFGFNELYEYKDLFYYMVLRDVKSIYKQTVLGFSWAIIRPVFSMIIFSLVFGKLANIPSDGIPYPVFTYAALIPWTYFSTALTLSTQSLISTKSIFTKVYFPRLIIPMVPVLSKLVDFLISFIILFFLMVFYKIQPNYNIIFLPCLILIMIATSFGVGCWLSALAIQFRDIPHGIQFLSQLLMYAAPVVWPLSLVSDKFGENASYLYSIYPMVGVIEGFRASLLGSVKMPFLEILIGAIASVILFLSGILYYRSKEKIFADVA